MSINFVQSAVIEASGVASLTANISSTGAGNLLVVCTGTFMNERPTSIHDTQGDTFAPIRTRSSAAVPPSYPAGVTNNSGSYAFNIAAGSTQVTVNFNAFVGGVVVLVSEYSGFGVTDPFVSYASSGVSNGTASKVTVSAKTLASSWSSNLYCGLAASTVSGTLTITANPAWNDRQHSSGSGVTSYDFIDLISTGTHNPNWKVPANTPFAPIGMVFTAAPLEDQTGLEYEVIRYW